MRRNIAAPTVWHAQEGVAQPHLALLVGAHLDTERKGYEHHSTRVGDGQVIHYAGRMHTFSADAASACR